MSSREARIVINGTPLTEAQSMAVRVALESFDSHLATDGLGDDEHGKEMVVLYRTRIQEIRVWMYLAAPKKETN